MGAEQTISPRGRYLIRAAVAQAVRECARGGEDTTALAERLGVTPATVTRWVDGAHHPSFTQAVRIAPLVGVNPETGKREPTP